MNRTLSLWLAVAAAVAPLTLAQVAVTPHLPIQTLSIPWDAGTAGEALFQASSGTTIPMFSYSFHATKDGSTRTGAMVGTSPFAAPTAVSIPSDKDGDRIAHVRSGSGR
jgi:hypothetical protein